MPLSYNIFLYQLVSTIKSFYKTIHNILHFINSILYYYSFIYIHIHIDQFSHKTPPSTNHHSTSNPTSSPTYPEAPRTHQQHDTRNRKQTLLKCNIIRYPRIIEQSFDPSTPGCGLVVNICYPSILYLYASEESGPNF